MLRELLDGLLGLQKAQERVLEINGVPHVLLHTGDSEKMHSFEAAQSNPARSRGTTAMALWSDFAALTSRLGNDRVRVYYTDQGAMRAVLNDDLPSAGLPAGWRDWTIDYAPPASEAWAAWCAMDGKMVSQLDMAEFIQERIADFVTPSGAAMLELAQQFDVHRSGVFSSGIRLDSGSSKLTVEEEARGRSEVAIPNKVELGMRVFDDLDAYSFQAYFRWRIRDNKLGVAFKIIDRREVLRAAVRDLVSRVQGQLPNNALYLVSVLPTATRTSP